MSVVFTIFDDPAAAEGGQALVRVLGAAVAAADDVLTLETLTEGAGYSGPTQIPVRPRAIDGGFEFAIGSDLVGPMPPGVSVALALENAGVGAEVVWPELTPARAPRRLTMRVAKPRVVVEASPPPEPTLPSLPLPPVPDKPKPPVDAPSTPVASVPPRPEPDTPPVVNAQAVTPPDPLVPPPDDTHVQLTPAPPPAPTRSLPLTAALLMTVVAFLLGAAAMAVVWRLYPTPAPTPSPSAQNAAAWPSPYAIFDRLSTRSPAGKPAAQNWPALLENGRAAEDPMDKAFWIEWATQKMLSSRQAGVAATLSDFATDVANNAEFAESGRFAAARFLWEMAASGGDCAAMDNIAASLSGDDAAGRAVSAEDWRGRASQCRSQRQ
ncbi:MAG: hypothetical protein ACLPN5_14385 [Roseiarcus sp.]